MITIPYRNAEPLPPCTDEDYDVKYMEIKSFNQFGGADIPYLQVLQSAAGYYIGDLCKADWMNEIKGLKSDQDFWEPYSRDSAWYWDTREEAETALIKYNYERKF